MTENDRKSRKMKENERLCPLMPQHERALQKMTENVSEIHPPTLYIPQHSRKIIDNKRQ